MRASRPMWVPHPLSLGQPTQLLRQQSLAIGVGRVPVAPLAEAHRIPLRACGCIIDSAHRRGGEVDVPATSRAAIALLAEDVPLQPPVGVDVLLGCLPKPSHPPLDLRGRVHAADHRVRRQIGALREIAFRMHDEEVILSVDEVSDTPPGNPLANRLWDEVVDGPLVGIGRQQLPAYHAFAVRISIGLASHGHGNMCQLVSSVVSPRADGAVRLSSLSIIPDWEGFFLRRESSEISLGVCACRRPPARNTPASARTSRGRPLGRPRQLRLRRRHPRLRTTPT